MGTTRRDRRAKPVSTRRSGCEAQHRWGLSGLYRAWTLASIVVASFGLAGCTGARPVLVDPVPEPTLDAAAFAAGLPDTARAPLKPADPSTPGEPTAQDAIWVWSQTVGVEYSGTCSSLTSDRGQAVCSDQVENFDVFTIGPNSDETWWVVEVAGTDANYRVGAVYPAGSE